MFGSSHHKHVFLYSVDGWMFVLWNFNHRKESLSRAEPCVFGESLLWPVHVCIMESCCPPALLFQIQHKFFSKVPVPGVHLGDQQETQ